MRRKRLCELCGGAALVQSLDLGTRMIPLCGEHARHAEQAGVTSLEALRALFVEASGRRSLLARRAASERRLFPPRPEGRRQRRGRRQSDAASTSAASKRPPNELAASKLPGARR